MPHPPLHLGFVGAGRNTISRHLPGFRALPGVEFIAVANRSPSSAEKVANDWKISRVETDWRDLVTSPDVDAVCIGTWPSLHAEISCTALAAGKHVLCEARMAADLTGARAMLAASTARPALVAQLVPAPHTLTFDACVRDTLTAGRLGAVRSVEIVHLHGEFIDLDSPPSWRLQSRHSGINMLTLGIFYEVLLRWLDTDAVVDSAQGTIRPPRLARTAEDASTGNIDLPEALTVKGHFPSLGGIPLSIHLNAITSGAPSLGITVRGDDGVLRWDGIAGKVSLTSRGKAPVILAAAMPDAWRVESDFVASIRDSQPVTRTDFSTGLRYMRFTDAVRRSLVWTTA